MDALMVYRTVAVLNLCIQFEIQCPAEEEVTPKKKMCFFFLFVISSFFLMTLLCCRISMKQWKDLLLYQLELLHVFKNAALTALINK